MRTSRIAVLAAVLIGLAVIVFFLARSSEKRSTSTANASSGAKISANGFSLASTKIVLPVDGQTFPDGPHVDVINANCTSCHSASMALTQPPLSADQWTAEVTKMREVYKAPVAEADVGAIVAYLTNMSARLPKPANDSSPQGLAAVRPARN